MRVPDWWQAVEVEIDHQLAGFTDKLREKLRDPPSSIINKKNPFLLRVRSANDLDTLAKMVINAYISSSEETRFGSILEAIALAVCAAAKGGFKSSAQGIDMEYDEDHIRYLIQVKSGPNWGNSSQQKKLVDDFNKAKQRLHTIGLNVQCIQGSCYGSSCQKDKGSHLVLVGGLFWQKISGGYDIHHAIHHKLGEYAENGLNHEKELAKHRLIQFLIDEGVAPQGNLNWQNLFDLLF